ncbi:hypothetical protein ACROYT_G041501 [Oculina patagonica]
MKAFFFLVVVLVGCANAKPYPAKRTSSPCSAFPKQLSGRLYAVTVDKSGSATHVDMKFNLDRDLQMMQAEATVGDMGPFNIVMDYKGGKTYVVYPGGCHTGPLTNQTLSPEELKDLRFETSGILGLKGTLVDLYSLKNIEPKGMMTLEAGDQCIPASYAQATNDNESASAGSFLDLKTTVDTEKMKIPEHCDAQISRRSIPALIHSMHLKQAVKRGFPWIDLQDTQKRGFPWLPLSG